MVGIKNFSINKKNRNLLKIVIGGVAFLFLFLFMNSFVTPIKNFFYAITAPVEKIFWFAGSTSSSFVTSFLKAGSLSKENLDLESENRKLLSQIAFLQSVNNVNQAQADISLSYQNSDIKLLMAGVVGLDDDGIISINKGLDDGAEIGMPVINQDNVLFGKIIDVYRNFSRVMLVSNENSVVNVRIKKNQDEQGNFLEEIDGVVKGRGGVDAYLDLIPINKQINPNDVLVISVIDRVFPKDLLVGRVAQIEKNDQEPFQRAMVELFLDIQSSDNLFVITNYKQQ